MSTTTDLEVAVAYSISPSSLLFKFKTTSFMQRGADLQYLSAFPAEREGKLGKHVISQEHGLTLSPVESQSCTHR